jgi:alpha-tubulin suppressor-like RCC1 family protein
MQSDLVVRKNLSIFLLPWMLEDDGTVWTWKHPRNNRYGKLLHPVQVSGLSGVIAIAAGGDHTLTLKKDGTVWDWNDHGQLGDGSTTDRHTPVHVKGISGIITIAVGHLRTVGLKDNGTVWTWAPEGLNDGTVTKLPTPEQVKGLSGVVAIAAGGSHTVALKNDGTVWAWGGNRHGELESIH